jgi:arylsulfatase A-like enzyme
VRRALPGLLVLLVIMGCLPASEPTRSATPAAVPIVSPAPMLQPESRPVGPVPARESAPLASTTAVPETRTTAPLPAPSALAQPNILVVTVDTLRADHVGAYGGGASTPTFDLVASDGVRFAHAYAQEPQTNPNHSSLFTGQYPATHGVRIHPHQPLPAEPITLAELLQQHGYRTGAIQSWYSLDGAISGLDRGFQTYRSVALRAGTTEVLAPGEAEAAWRRGEDMREFIDGRADATTDAALSWLEDAARERSQPFFLWVHYMDPHDPYEPPSPYDELYAPRCAGCVDGSLATLRRLDSGWRPTPAELERIHAAYDGEITFTDHEMSRLLSRLDALGLTSRTLVVLTADHGEAFGEHDEWFHGIKLYQTTLHIPLIMRLPGVIPAGATVEVVARTIDIMPTVLDLADLPTPPRVEGRSLRPAFEGRDTDEDVAIAEVADRRFNAVIERDWKLIRDNSTGRRELYHLPTDPAEQTNRLATDRAIAEQLESRLNAWVAARPGARQ